MALTLSGTNGVVGAGFTVDASGVSVTAGIGTFSSLNAAASGLTGALPALDAANLTSVNAAQLVGVCTSGLTKTGGFGKIIQVVSATKTDTASNSTATTSWWSYTDTSLRVTLTPSSATNKILVWGTISYGVDSTQWMTVRLEKDGSRLDAGNGDQDGNKSRTFTAQNYTAESGSSSMPYTNSIVQYLDTAGNTSSRYYNFGIAHFSGSTRTIYINRGTATSNAFSTPQCASTITAMEIEA